MPHRIKGGQYVSYKTHSFCSLENKWFDKKQHPGRYCPDCGRRVRIKRNRNTVPVKSKSYKLPLWKIKCVKCKSEFYQDKPKTKNCQKCRFKCSKKARENQNEKRRNNKHG